jgi:hypothetical protein
LWVAAGNAAALLLRAGPLPESAATVTRGAASPPRGGADGGYRSGGKRRAEIVLDQRNAAIESQIDRERAKRVEVDERLAMLVEEYNVLIDERRFAEAEAIAKKAAQLSPDNAVVRQLLSQSRIIRRLDTQKSIDGDKQTGFLDVAEDSEQAAVATATRSRSDERESWLMGPWTIARRHEAFQPKGVKGRTATMHRIVMR